MRRHLQKHSPNETLLCLDVQFGNLCVFKPLYGTLELLGNTHSLHETVLACDGPHGLTAKHSAFVSKQVKGVGCFCVINSFHSTTVDLISDHEPASSAAMSTR